MSNNARSRSGSLTRDGGLSPEQRLKLESMTTEELKAEADTREQKRNERNSSVRGHRRKPSVDASVDAQNKAVTFRFKLMWQGALSGVCLLPSSHAVSCSTGSFRTRKKDHHVLCFEER